MILTLGLLLVAAAVDAVPAADLWYDLSPEGTPPSARYYHSSIYDPVRHQLVVFGGWSGACLNDTWVVDLTGTPQWSPLVTEGEPPPARLGHSAVYDIVRDRMIVFGGADADGRRNDVWALSLAGTPTWNQLAVAGDTIPPLADHVAIYDPSGDRMILFGGTMPGDVESDQTWALSLGDPPAWTLLETGDPPPARGSAAAVYDAAHERMVVFGGAYGLSGLFNDTWALSLGETPGWTEIPVAGDLPHVRYAHDAVFDAAGVRMIIFGGNDGQGSGPGNDLNDTWVLSLDDPTSWVPLAPEGGPPPGRSGSASVYDWGSHRMVVFGGGNSDGPMNDVWALSLDSDPEQRLFLQAGGEVNGQSVDASDNEIIVQQGGQISGLVRLRHENDNCGGTVVPLVYAPTWGDHATSWMGVSNDDPCGTTDHEVPISLTAPWEPGTYFLVFAAAAQISGAHIASMTSWICGPPIWDDGNDLADLDEPDLVGSLTTGYAWLPGWECSYLQNWVHGVTYVKIVVQRSEYRIFLAEGGNLNGQAVSAADNEVVVQQGGALTGTIRLHAENDNCGGAVVPLAGTPSWGDHASSWFAVTEHVPCGGQDYDVPVQLTVPWEPGTYYLSFASGGQVGAVNVAAMTSWLCQNPIFGDGNDLADLDEVGMAGALERGCAWVSGLECDGSYQPWLQGISYVKVTVAPSDYRIFLVDGGSLNERPVGPADNTIEVNPGAHLQGVIRVRHENGNCGGAVVPLAYAPSWGDHETSWAAVSENDWPCGVHLHDVPIDLVVPTEPGTYYINFASGGQVGARFVASMTSWLCGTPVWNDGNDLADLDDSEMASAPEYGCAWVPGLECDGTYQHWLQGVAYVKIIVAHREYRLFLAEGSSIDGQAVSGADNVIEVGRGWPLEGAIRIRHENANCGGAVVPVAYAPSWGDHESSWATVSWNDHPCGVYYHDVPLSLTAPADTGTYYVSFASGGQTDPVYVASMTSWLCGDPVWNDGNDLADLDESEMIGALETGEAIVLGRECDGTYQPWAQGVTYVKVVVLPDGVGVDENVPIPQETRLLAARPNPFAQETRIAFDLARGADAEVAIFDATGRRLRNLLSETLPAGRHELVWDGRDDARRAAAPGVYFARLRADGRLATQRVVLIR